MSAEPASLAQKIAAKRRAGIPLTDTGNAERLVLDHGDELRHASGLGWLVWDGRRWRLDREGKDVARRMKATVRAMRAEAADLPSGDESKALFNHANRSESAAKIDAALKQATREEAIDADAADFDASPLLLNLENGTLDLETGKLRDHDPADLLTKLAPVKYDPHAECSTWTSCLETWFDGDAELIEFAQRAVGYSLTGDTDEQVLFMLYGDGANGKSTFIETLRALIGDKHDGGYAVTADAGTFTRQRAGGPRPEIAALAGARFVPAIEIEEGAQLAEVLVKQVTGGDLVTVRPLYQAPITFRPAFKLWLAVNHLPEVRGDDHAIWRRIRVLPFDAIIPSPDRSLPAKLARERSGILNWALEGCRRWQLGGLGESGKIDAAIEAYKFVAGADDLGAWLSECCELDADAETPAGELHTSYNRWREERGRPEATATKFGRELVKHGLERNEAARPKTYLGVRIGGDE